MRDQRYVVGVDGSAGARAALRWAMSQAAGHEGDSIHAVAAWRREPTATGTTSPKAQKERLTAMLTAEIDALPEEDRSHTPISTEVEEGTPEEVLVDACKDDDILVLGRHGHGKAWHMLVGWTTEACARKVACPVVIVPPGAVVSTKPRGKQAR